MARNLEVSCGGSVPKKPPILIAGAFLSQSTGIRFVCEDLAAGLRERHWPVITTSSIRARGPRLADMLATVWLKRHRYMVAQLDVYSGAAFIWAEAVAGSLAALKCPYVVTLHDGALPQFAERWPGRVRRLLTSATAVTSPSPYLQRHFSRIRPDIRVVPNGLHITLYPERRITKARPRLVWVRAFERCYNPRLALEVMTRLVPDFPDVELLMVGPDRGDWSGERTLSEAERMGLGGQVKVIGGVPKTDIPGVLQAGDIFLNTTNVDNAPVIVVEAMACGLCVVSTEAGGVPDLVENGREALLVSREDPDAMTRAVKSILLDPGLASKLSAGARKRAERHAWETVLDEWEEILLGLVGGR